MKTLEKDCAISQTTRKLLFSLQYRGNPTLDPSQLQQWCSAHLWTNALKGAAFRILILHKIIIFSLFKKNKQHVSGLILPKATHCLTLKSPGGSPVLRGKQVLKCFLRGTSESSCFQMAEAGTGCTLPPVIGILFT